ncbi:cellular nucleic acid-binding protein-like [Gigantopelta aegis]|uniref:cellular nucleic acid-binding protein-like n=1 Tax=Gigantopelta aegis TaxID=1735272 RepID=UPI001B88DF2A|nr:cellular nucleic acid-binding protein-like [Gigantopelta aegis]
MSGGGGDMEREEKKKISYKKECTVVIDVGDNKKMAAGELIDFLTEQVGDMIHACVPKGPDRRNKVCACEIPTQHKEFANTVEGVEYFRVLHDNQLKVCYNCMSDSHVIKDCPDTVCHFCKGKGHYARNCNKIRCERCGNNEDECVCSEHEHDSECFGDSDSDSDGMNEAVTVRLATQENMLMRKVLVKQ